MRKKRSLKTLQKIKLENLVCKILVPTSTKSTEPIANQWTEIGKANKPKLIQFIFNHPLNFADNTEKYDYIPISSAQYLLRTASQQSLRAHKTINVKHIHRFCNTQSSKIYKKKKIKIAKFEFALHLFPNGLTEIYNGFVQLILELKRMPSDVLFVVVFMNLYCTQTQTRYKQTKLFSEIGDSDGWIWSLQSRNCVNHALLQFEAELHILQIKYAKTVDPIKDYIQTFPLLPRVTYEWKWNEIESILNEIESNQSVLNMVYFSESIANDMYCFGIESNKDKELDMFCNLLRLPLGIESITLLFEIKIGYPPYKSTFTLDYRKRQCKMKIITDDVQWLLETEHESLSIVFSLTIKDVHTTLSTTLSKPRKNDANLKNVQKKQKMRRFMQCWRSLNDGLTKYYALNNKDLSATFLNYIHKMQWNNGLIERIIGNGIDTDTKHWNWELLYAFDGQFPIVNGISFVNNGQKQKFMAYIFEYCYTNANIPRMEEMQKMAHCICKEWKAMNAKEVSLAEESKELSALQKENEKKGNANQQRLNEKSNDLSVNNEKLSAIDLRILEMKEMIAKLERDRNGLRNNESEMKHEWNEIKSKQKEIMCVKKSLKKKKKVLKVRQKQFTKEKREKTNECKERMEQREREVCDIRKRIEKEREMRVKMKEELSGVFAHKIQKRRSEIMKAVNAIENGNKCAKTEKLEKVLTDHYTFDEEGLDVLSSLIEQNREESDSENEMGIQNISEAMNDEIRESVSDINQVKSEHVRTESNGNYTLAKESLEDITNQTVTQSNEVTETQIRSQTPVTDITSKQAFAIEDAESEIEIEANNKAESDENKRVMGSNATAIAIVNQYLQETKDTDVSGQNEQEFEIRNAESELSVGTQTIVITEQEFDNKSFRMDVNHESNHLRIFCEEKDEFQESFARFSDKLIANSAMALDEQMEMTNIIGQVLQTGDEQTMAKLVMLMNDDSVQQMAFDPFINDKMDSFTKCLATVGDKLLANSAMTFNEQMEIMDKICKAIQRAHEQSTMLMDPFTVNDKNETMRLESEINDLVSQMNIDATQELIEHTDISETKNETNTFENDTFDMQSSLDIDCPKLLIQSLKTKLESGTAADNAFILKQLQSLEMLEQLNDANSLGLEPQLQTNENETTIFEHAHEWSDSDIEMNTYTLSNHNLEIQSLMDRDSNNNISYYPITTMLPPNIDIIPKLAPELTNDQWNQSNFNQDTNINQINVNEPKSSRIQYNGGGDCDGNISVLRSPCTECGHIVHSVENGKSYCLGCNQQLQKLIYETKLEQDSISLQNLMKNHPLFREVLTHPKRYYFPDIDEKSAEKALSNDENVPVTVTSIRVIANCVMDGIIHYYKHLMAFEISISKLEICCMLFNDEIYEWCNHTMNVLNYGMTWMTEILSTLSIEYVNERSDEIKKDMKTVLHSLFELYQYYSTYIEKWFNKYKMAIPTDDYSSESYSSAIYSAEFDIDAADYEWDGSENGYEYEQPAVMIYDYGDYTLLLDDLTTKRDEYKRKLIQQALNDGAIYNGIDTLGKKGEFNISQKDIKKFCTTTADKRYAKDKFSLSDCAFKVYLFPNGSKTNKQKFVRFGIRIMNIPTHFSSAVIYFKLYETYTDTEYRCTKVFENSATLKSVCHTTWYQTQLKLDKCSAQAKLQFQYEVQVLRLISAANNEIIEHSKGGQPGFSLHFPLEWTFIINKQQLLHIKRCPDMKLFYSQMWKDMFCLSIGSMGKDENINMALHILKLPPKVMKMECQLEMFTNCRKANVHFRSKLRTFDYNSTKLIIKLRKRQSEILFDYYNNNVCHKLEFSFDLKIVKIWFDGHMEQPMTFHSGHCSYGNKGKSDQNSVSRNDKKPKFTPPKCTIQKRKNTKHKRGNRNHKQKRKKKKEKKKVQKQQTKQDTTNNTHRQHLTQRIEYYEKKVAKVQRKLEKHTKYMNVGSC